MLSEYLNLVKEREEEKQNLKELGLEMERQEINRINCEEKE